MNFHRDRSVGAVCIALLTLLTLSSCGQKAPDSTSSSTPSTTASTSSSTSTTESTSSSTSPSTTESTSSSTSPEASTVAAGTGVKPQGTSCPTSAPVKGNLTKRGNKIYHVPGSPNYSKVKPEDCFADAAAAQKAGYRAPKQQK